jgi:hypothetical protein
MPSALGIVLGASTSMPSAFDPTTDPPNSSASGLGTMLSALGFVPSVLGTVPNAPTSMPRPASSMPARAKALWFALGTMLSALGIVPSRLGMVPDGSTSMSSPVRTVPDGASSLLFELSRMPKGLGIAGNALTSMLAVHGVEFFGSPTCLAARRSIVAREGGRAARKTRQDVDDGCCPSTRSRVTVGAHARIGIR